MEDYEKLGVFYLGRPYDLATKSPKDGLILYDSKDLVTHGVCVGMTGSGKTGLCIALLEEAALDGVPAIVIDPKGDLPNLLLTFPELRPEDFAPWINEDDARKKGLSAEEYSKQQAEMWKKGLAGWGQSGERIGRLRQAADFVIYTPGSSAGIPVSILKSFAAPPAAIIDDSELLGDRISSTATSLLGLMGIEADPIRSREHILISTILDSSWKQGRDLDLAALIQHIQTPPVAKIGVMDIESFYPSKERFELALSLNNLLAAPGFNAWLEGEPLDIDRILHAPDGKPRISIFSIAHLNDAERMFFVSLLLNQILGWTRMQSGTTSLRAIVYMDEIFGFFPPVANPPSKTPLLTLLKQARAFGVGILLATQNPVDLDYKGLSNAGTWLIGRLQTERDKMRVLEGLEGAAASTGIKFDRQSMEETLAGLGSRIFLMNDVHEDAPEIFETRWAMSYLRGPVTRNQIKLLMDPKRSTIIGKPVVGAAAQVPSSPGVSAYQAPAAAVSATAKKAERPLLPPDISQYFIPIRGSQPTGQTLIYNPMLLGLAQVHFADIKTGVDVAQESTFVTQITEDPIAVNWDNSAVASFNISDLDKSPNEPAQYSQLPAATGNARNYGGWNKDFADWLYRNQKLELLRSPTLKQFSNLGESERDFRIRLQQDAREQRDEATEKLRQKYASKMATLEEQVRRAQQAVEREAEQAKQQKMQTAVSVGATLLSAFVGRKAVSYSSLGRATTAVRGASRIMKESQDIKQAQETVATYQQRLQELESSLKAETEALAAKSDPLTEELEKVIVRPAKKDISVRLTTLVWMPNWQSPEGKLTPAWN
ncbi:MAG: ATP-binding protein [Chloroflexi bacterium]|nr:ATP-binding protein [Chloroflexota bacterium]